MANTGLDEGQEEADFNEEDCCQCVSPVTSGGVTFADVGRRSTHCRICSKPVLRRGPKIHGGGRK